jgi:hypothetical protein
VQSILFGASSKSNIRETVSLIREFDLSEEVEMMEQYNHIKIY